MRNQTIHQRRHRWKSIRSALPSNPPPPTPRPVSIETNQIKFQWNRFNWLRTGCQRNIWSGCGNGVGGGGGLREGGYHNYFDVFHCFFFPVFFLFISESIDWFVAVYWLTVVKEEGTGLLTGWHVGKWSAATSVDKTRATVTTLAANGTISSTWCWPNHWTEVSLSAENANERRMERKDTDHQVNKFLPALDGDDWSPFWRPPGNAAPLIIDHRRAQFPCWRPDWPFNRISARHFSFCLASK